LHRVVHDEFERYSTVFFYYPSYDAKIPTIPCHDSRIAQRISLLKNQSSGKEKLDANLSTSFGEYITQKWDQVYRSGYS